MLKTATNSVATRTRLTTMAMDAPIRLGTRSSADPNLAAFSLASPELPSVISGLPFAEQVRRALIRNRVGTSHSEAITGKLADGTPLNGHSHAHYLPTDEDHDGRIDHLTIYAPGGFDDADVEALRSLRTIFRSGGRPEVGLTLIELEGNGGFDGVSLFGEARRWRSVTPFSLPRFANRGGGKPARPRDLPEAQLCRELRSRGLPNPVTLLGTDGYVTNDGRIIPWSEFEVRRFNGTQGHGVAGFEIEFPEPVRGPIALGFGCHFGLGFFLPATSDVQKPRPGGSHIGDH